MLLKEGAWTSKENDKKDLISNLFLALRTSVPG